MPVRDPRKGRSPLERALEEYERQQEAARTGQFVPSPQLSAEDYLARGDLASAALLGTSFGQALGRTALQATASALFQPSLFERYGLVPSTGNPTLDAITSFLGQTVGALPSFAVPQAAVARAGQALSRVPQAAELAARMPQLARLIGRGAAEGALYSAIQAAVNPPEYRPTAQDVLRETLFFAGAAPAGAIAAARLPEALNPYLRAGAVGAASGIGGALAGAPVGGTTPADLASSALTMAALGTLGQLGRAPQPAQTPPVGVREITPAGAQQAAEVMRRPLPSPEPVREVIQPAPEPLRPFAGQRLTRFELQRMRPEQQREVAALLTPEVERTYQITVAPAAREYLAKRFDPRFDALITAWERHGVPDDLILRAVNRTDPKSLTKRQQQVGEGIVDLPMYRGGWVRIREGQMDWRAAVAARKQGPNPQLLDLSKAAQPEVAPSGEQPVQPAAKTAPQPATTPAAEPEPRQLTLPEVAPELPTFKVGDVVRLPSGKTGTVETVHSASLRVMVDGQRMTVPISRVQKVETPRPSEPAAAVQTEQPAPPVPVEPQAAPVTAPVTAPSQPPVETVRPAESRPVEPPPATEPVRVETRPVAPTPAPQQPQKATPPVAVEQPAPAPVQPTPAVQQPSPQRALSPLRPVVQGAQATVATERGTRANVRYAVVEASDLVTSHDTALRANPAYPAELQPRDRSRLASEVQIQNIANRLQPEFLGESPKASEGAPIVGPDAAVESGNARTIALKRLYEQNHANAQAYRDWLIQNAERFGLDPEAVRQAKQPVLVRVRESEVNRPQWAVEANEAAVAAMSATEQALSDARRMSDELMADFHVDDEGRIANQFNYRFMTRFFDQVVGPTERGRYMLPDGGISQEGINRIQNAVFAKAYGSADAVQRLAEDPDNNIRNITAAMLQAAPRIAKLKTGIERGEFYNLDPTQEIAAAAGKLAQLRGEGQTVEAYLAQTSLFGEDLSPLARDFLALFDQSKRSRKRLADVLNTYADMVEAQGNPKQVGLFGETNPPSREEILQAAIQEVNRRYGAGGEQPAQTSLFGGAGQPAPGTTGAGTVSQVATPSGTAGFPATATAVRTGAATAAAPATEQPVARRAIIKYIEDNFLVPLRSGRMVTRGTAGEYKVREQVIRTRQREDLQTAAHELGHHLTQTLRLNPAKYPELEKLGANLYPEAERGKKLFEGLADWFRLYLIDPAQARQQAPSFTADFETRLRQDPQLHGKISELQQLYGKWYSQNARDRILGAISTEPVKEKPWQSFAERLYTNWLDDLHPVYRTVAELAGDPRKLATGQNPYLLARLARATARQATSFISEGAFGPDHTVRGPGLKQILEPIRDRIDDFRSYAIAKRALERAQRDFKTGIDPADAAAVVKQYQTPEFEQALQQIQRYRETLLEHLVDAGVLSYDDARRILAFSEDYVPFVRLIEGQAQGRPSRESLVNLPDPIKQFVGSGATIIDPIESLVKDTFRILDVAARNRPARALAELAAQAKGKGWLIEEVPMPVRPIEMQLGEIKRELVKAGVPEEALQQADLNAIAKIWRAEVPPGVREQKDNIISVWVDGQRKFYQVHPDLYQALTSLQPEENGLLTQVLRVLGLPARVARAGATLNPEFAVRNPIRDVLTATVNAGMHPQDFARGLFHVLNKDDLYREWERAGGAMSALVSLDREYLQGQVRQLIGAQSRKDKLAGIARKPIEILQMLSETTEEATRVGYYAKQPRATREERLKAAYGSREVTVDFSRAGRVGRQANRLIAFFNASLQGPDRMVRQFKDDPTGSTLRALAYITVPSVLLWLKNHDDPRYQELPRWRKDLYWVIPKGDTMVYIPKPFELGVIFGALPERVLEFIAQRDPQAIKDWATSLFEATTPGTKPADYVPTALVPLLEAWSNRSTFTEAPIVPASEQGLESWAQYGPRTSELAKAIGRVLNVSPRVVDNLIWGYFGGLGGHALDLIDLLAGEATSKKTPGELIPGFQAFEGQPYRSAQSVDDLYQRRDELQRRKATAAKGRGRPLTQAEQWELRRLDRAAEDLSQIRKQLSAVLESKTHTAEQKRLAQQIANWMMVNRARTALGRVPIPPDKSGLPADVQQQLGGGQ